MIKIDRCLTLESCDSWDNIGTILEHELLQLTFPGQMVSQLYAYMVRNDKRSSATGSLKNQQLLFCRKASCLKAVGTFSVPFFLQERDWVMKEFKEGNLAKKDEYDS